MLVTQLCSTLCKPMDSSLPGSSVHGILQTRMLEWVAMPFSRGSSQSRGQTRVFSTPWTAAHQASLSITNSWSLLKPMSIALVMPSNHLILCCALLLLPSVFPSMRAFSSESVLRIRWLKYWSFSFSISPSNEYLGLIPEFQFL